MNEITPSKTVDELTRNDCRYYAGSDTFRDHVCLHPRLRSLICVDDCKYIKLKKALIPKLKK